MIVGEIKKAIVHSLSKLFTEASLSVDQIPLEHPAELAHGDYASSIALQLAGKAKLNPRALAEKLKEQLEADGELAAAVSNIEVAGPGFLNFTLSKNYYAQTLAGIDAFFGKNNALDGKKAIVEYTDPNPFKVLHIGHLMSNAIGESLSRIIEWSGAATKRACYQGDVGMHVAKSIWGLMDLGVQQIPRNANLSEQVAYLGKAYAHGSAAYEEGTEEQKVAIKQLNKAIYEQSNPEVNELYAWGRKVSLDYFETQYAQLGTKFDFYFFESEVADTGVQAVRAYLKQGIFKESEGAVVFPGEEYGLHTRVFLNSEGLPTYEAKELGLAKVKYDTYPYDLSVVVTGNEINQYFQVLLKAMSFAFPELAEKTVHVGHGMLRLPSGKMSSRTGTVVSAESLILQALEKANEKEVLGDEHTYLQIAIGAIKFSILSQSAGSDIIFDFEKSLSFDGDSGPYLQYTQARCQSILRKAAEEGVSISTQIPDQWETREIERLLYRFPEAVQRSLADYSPHHIATYLIEIARSYNSFYGNEKIVDANDPASGYKLAITAATAQILRNGLWLLGIEAPERM